AAFRQSPVIGNSARHTLYLRDTSYVTGELLRDGREQLVTIQPWVRRYSVSRCPCPPLRSTMPSDTRRWIPYRVCDRLRFAASAMSWMFMVSSPRTFHNVAPCLLAAAALAAAACSSLLCGSGVPEAIGCTGCAAGAASGAG